MIVGFEKVDKKFRNGKDDFSALQNITFQINPGKIIGLLGPDGSGKTTLLRLITGLLRPTAGKIEVLGLDSVKDAAKIQSQIGYMPQKFGLYEDMSVIENLSLYADLHDVPTIEAEKRFEKLLKMTDLADFKKRYAGNLSGGMKQKLALCCALVSQPQLLLLDEPTVGVDVLSRRELWNILRQIVLTQQVTVLCSTAYLDEAEFCDDLLVLYEGKLIRRLTPAELKNMAAPFTPNPDYANGFQALIYQRIFPPITRKNPLKSTNKLIINAEKLIKKFGSFTAVNQVSFQVHQGEIFGLLGANGAGKTTTFRMLCNLSPIDGGHIEIAGCDLITAASSGRAKIGFVAQKFSLYSELSVFNNLEFFGGAYGLEPVKLKERIEWALDSFHLRSYSKSLAGKLPLGFKQRLSMACALLHEPEILFLDEATSGADPLARHEFWSRIIELADSGVAVIITTHFLDEAKYCDNMVVMQHGNTAASGNEKEICAIGKSDSLEESFVNIIRDFRETHGAS